MFTRCHRSQRAGKSARRSLRFENLEDRHLLATFTVTTNADVGSGTLRQAMADANAFAGADIIQFNIAGGGTHSIRPASNLPTITDPVTIDGTSQPGYVNMPIIELDGTNAGFANGLTVASGATLIKGLAINRFTRHGIEISGPGGNAISKNFIGTSLTGMVAAPNGLYGVYIVNSPNNLIGAANGAPGRNVISANFSGGIGIFGAAATGNAIRGNYLGTDMPGTSALGGGGGVLIQDAPQNAVGASVPGTGNLISGNGGTGIKITGANASANTVHNNLIGLNAAGSGPLGNTIGMTIDNAPNNVIGGTLLLERNIISANANAGINIQNAGATGNLVQGNFIGTDITGTIVDHDGIAANGNDMANFSGVVITDAANNRVGGAFPGLGTAPCSGPCNVISGNGHNGVSISGVAATGNVVQGNMIGTDVSGTLARGNNAGIQVGFQAHDNQIGGAAVGEGNLISSNTVNGMFLFSGDANTIQGNRIGTDGSGTLDLGNGGDGILLTDSKDNVIGGSGTGMGNVVSGNEGDGIEIQGAVSLRTIVQGNRIGVRLTGTGALGNSSHGVYITGINSQIGGASPAHGNVIANNGADGVYVNNFNATGNVILTNSIYSNGALGIDLQEDGVTANDPGDGDVGSNNKQNYPVLTRVTRSPSDVTIEGTLNSTPNTLIKLQFFSNSAPDPSNHGEGHTFLGSTVVVTDAVGDVSFTSVQQVSVPAGHFVTATATDPANNTSEFSAARLVETPAVADINVLNFGTLPTDVTQLKVTYSITGADADPFELAFYSSADARWDAGDVNQGNHRMIIEPNDLTMGQHTVQFDGGQYQDTLAGIFDLFLPPPPHANFVLVVANPLGSASEPDPTNNDLNFVGVFHAAATAAAPTSLVVRGRDDTDRYQDDANDMVEIRQIGTDLDITGTLGQSCIPMSQIMDIRHFGGGGDDLATVDAAIQGLYLGGAGDDELAVHVDRDLSLTPPSPSALGSVVEHPGQADETKLVFELDERIRVVADVPGTDVMINGTDDDDEITVTELVPMEFDVRGKVRELDWPLLILQDVQDALVNGNDGHDTIVVDAIVAPEDLPRIYTLNGGDGNDTIQGSDRPDVMYGGNGDDILIDGDGSVRFAPTRLAQIAMAGTNSVSVLGPVPVGLELVFDPRGRNREVHKVTNVSGPGGGPHVVTLDQPLNFDHASGEPVRHLDDYLDGGMGQDALLGGAGDDVLYDCDPAINPLTDGGTGIDTLQLMGTSGGNDQFRFMHGSSLTQILITLDIGGTMGQLTAHRVERTEVDGGGGAGADLVAVEGRNVANEMLLLETGPLTGKVRELDSKVRELPFVPTARPPGEAVTTSTLRLEVEFHNLGSTTSSVELDGGGGRDTFSVEHYPGWQIRDVTMLGGGTPDPSTVNFAGTEWDDLMTYLPMTSGPDRMEITSGGATTRYMLSGIPDVTVDGRGQITADSLAVQTTCPLQHTPGTVPGTGSVVIPNCGNMTTRTLQYENIESLSIPSASMIFQSSISPGRSKVFEIFASSDAGRFWELS